MRLIRRKNGGAMERDTMIHIQDASCRVEESVSMNAPPAVEAGQKEFHLVVGPELGFHLEALHSDAS